MENEIDGLNLMDYKEIEREATESLRSGRKIVLASHLMLINAETRIAKLGGQTLKEEDEAALV